MATDGLSMPRLARMRAVMAGYVERGELPGLVTLVSRRGEAHAEAIGSKTAGGDDPVQRDHRSRQLNDQAYHRGSGDDAG
jgi:hypothetical protein